MTDPSYLETVLWVIIIMGSACGIFGLLALLADMVAWMNKR